MSPSPAPAATAPRAKPVARTRSRARRWLRRLGIGFGVLLALLAIGAGLLWWSLPDVSGLADRDPKTTAFIELRRAQAAAAGHRFELHWDWRPLGKISPFLRSAVVHAEDARFYEHEGVDWDALQQAAEKDWEDKTLSTGGSTITQQVAKNLYLSPSRSPIRKLREILIARRLEHALSKRRILEVYLNIAEWGDGVFGAEAAARRWFGRSAAALTPAQAARLAVALPNPFERSPRERSPLLVSKAARLVRHMRRDGLIDRAGLLAALADLGATPTAKESAGPAPAAPAP